MGVNRTYFSNSLVVVGRCSQNCWSYPDGFIHLRSILAAPLKTVIYRQDTREGGQIIIQHKIYNRT